jgi:hypothetical protein
MDHPTFVPYWARPHRAKSYSRIHGMLIERRGDASTYLCACGEQALRWAYQHSAGEAELKNDKGHPYSLDLRDYEPMCAKCHHALDTRHGLKKRLDSDPELLEKYRETLQKHRSTRTRRRCSCGREMRSTSMGRHQKASGCVGWETV